MRIAYLDCIGGASGDMLLSALLDAGASEASLRGVIPALCLRDCRVEVKKVMSGALSATQVDVVTPQQEDHRHASELIAMVNDADLPERVRTRAKKIVERIARAEARIHNSDPASVHLHEVGGDDTLIDVVGVVNALDELGIEHVAVSTLPLARGFIECMHGRIPLPAPATLALLDGVPVRYVEEVEAELVTPTGAAILTTLADSFGGFPTMQILRTGTGAGHRSLPFPNVLRVWIGETEQRDRDLIVEHLTLLETNIDDLNPQVFEHVMGRLFAAGALDVTFTPVQMKKNRAGQMLSVLCAQGDVERMQDILFSETVTLGIRRMECERVSLARVIEPVATPFGTINVKVARWRDVVRATPEYEDCRRAAEAFQVPILQVMAAAQEIYRSKLP